MKRAPFVLLHITEILVTLLLSSIGACTQPDCAPSEVRIGMFCHQLRAPLDAATANEETPSDSGGSVTARTQPEAEGGATPAEGGAKSTPFDRDSSMSVAIDSDAMVVDAAKSILDAQARGRDDAGVSVPVPGSDASADIPATQCPESLTCNDVASGFSSFGLPPAKFCTESGSITPPECTTQKDCTDMGFTLSTCMPLPTLSVFLPGNFCLRSCK
jgi:hypothetical protein